MINCVIIDDEEDSIQYMESIIHDHCPGLQATGHATSVSEGVDLIETLNPDLIFLDVELGDGTGFDILESVNDRNFEVIFITAHNKYAIRAFKHSAVDYLLKPVNIDELKDSVDKVISKNHTGRTLDNLKVLLENIRSDTPKKLVVSSSDGYEYINVNDILRLEADRSYCNIFLVNGRKILVSRSMNDYQRLLNDNTFFRTHNSHLINLHHVKMYVKKDGGYIEMTDGSKIPLARRKKDMFIEAMKLYIS
ncbi:MAG: response regulator transcription factor [Bacteroidales bacterium]|nr:response regulator transcription factor [Bacteroidales bacterium]